MQVDVITQASTILVVDDNPTNIQVLFDLLSETGYRVAIAKNGETALQRLQSYQPDLILLDVMMPGIDGFETCQRLKANPFTQEIPVIFMTALSDPVDKVKGLKLGAVDYITKPIQHEEVLARIQIHLQLRNSMKALEKRTAELTQALDDLKQAQVQLVQSEKMSSLGQLVAGIAHEINNPVNFIHGNVAPAEEEVQELLALLDLYQECYPQPDPRIQAWMAEYDLEFLREDLPKLLYSMKMGSDRIRQIVLTLRNFSRLDEAEMKPVNIHEGIDSTLLILQHRLKATPERAKIEVIKKYSHLPVVECYPGKLNQVFLNILSNAIDALEEQKVEQKKKQLFPELSIHIVTETIDKNWIRIRIKDNGVGIEENNNYQLFKPFFTTKPVGQGTGLGLSISYQIIVDWHGGRLYFTSTPGQGTEFTIEIPLVQNAVVGIKSSQVSPYARSLTTKDESLEKLSLSS